MKSKLLSALLVLALLTGLIGSAYATQYNKTTLGTLGGTYSKGAAINDSNVVVGTSKNAAGYNRAFIWNGTSMQDLGTLGGNNSYGYTINNNGQVAGYADVSSTSNGTFRWAATSGMQYVTGFGNDSEKVVAMNDAGNIAGTKWTSDPRSGYTWKSVGYFNSSNVWRDVTGYGTECLLYTTCINNNGWIGGCLIDSYGAGIQRGVIFDAVGHEIDLTVSGTTNGSHFDYSRVSGVNDNNMAVGNINVYYDTWNTTRHAFLWDCGSNVIDLGSFTGISGYSYAYDINNKGQVVGYSSYADGTNHAFVWDSINGMQDLGQGYAYGINENGWIVGYTGTAGSERAVVWAPVPEPSSVLALLSGICGLGGMIIRKRQ